jgi:hypothetical protein
MTFIDVEGEMALASSLLINSILLFGAVQADEPVYFANPNLQAAVEDALWIFDPTPTDMQGLTYLDGSYLGIDDLTGLECATNLQTLILNDNQITDLTPLSGLVNLTKLVLHLNPLGDLTPLSGLRRLTTLDLRSTSASDISALGNLTNLSLVYLHMNEIGDISPLSGLHNLGMLYLSDNHVTDITALHGLDRLQYVSLDHNQIGDISPLSDLTSLQYLNIESNPLDQQAYDVHIPQILANNPGISLLYDPLPYVLSASTCVLSISSTGGGSVTNPGQGQFVYDRGDAVRIEAREDPGFVFAGWSGSVTGTTNPMQIVMSKDQQIRANFESTRRVVYVDTGTVTNSQLAHSAAGAASEDGTPEHPFEAIQDAIDVAAQGASVVVRTGTYKENVTLGAKSIHLTGFDPAGPNMAPYPVLDGADGGPVVTFSGGRDSNCVVEGFVITGGRHPTAGAVLCSSGSPTFVHCLLVGNRSFGPGGAIVCCSDSNAVFTNCTLADNYSGPDGAIVRSVNSHIVVTNSILWGNEPGQIAADDAGSVMIQYTDVAGGWPYFAAVPNNRDCDPQFAQRGFWANPSDPSVILQPAVLDAVWVGGDYHLKSPAGRWDGEVESWVMDAVMSPCIDAGDPAGPVGPEPSPNGGLVNIGAYGGTSQASKSTLSGP